MNIHNFEVITTRSKEQRDAMFLNFRKSDDKLERQVVKFSGSEPVIGDDGKQEVETHTTHYDGKQLFKVNRLKFVSNWSIAYPRS